MNAARARAVLLAGATGLVGRECLRALVADTSFHAIHLLVRRELVRADFPELDDARVQQHVTDFPTLERHAALPGVDQIICTLGTTIKAAGSRQAFRTVDHGYPLQLARLGLAAGVRHFLVVSAVGANSDSLFFYNRVKGEMERDLLALPYPAITILRPSLLLGDRGEFRLGEEVAKRLSFLMPRALKPVPARSVAACLVQQARADLPGRRIIDTAEIAACGEAR